MSSLPDEKVARIMADLYVAEAASYGLIGYSKDSLTRRYYDQVLQIHNITKEEYEKNLRIIANDLPHMEAIMSRVEEMLEPEKKGSGKTETNPVNAAPSLPNQPPPETLQRPSPATPIRR